MLTKSTSSVGETRGEGKKKIEKSSVAKRVAGKMKNLSVDFVKV